MSLQPKPETAVSFLTLMYPEGPWLLTAIPVERTHPLAGRPPTRTFMPGEEAQVEEWLAGMDGGEFNFYFSINPPNRALTKKARRTDIEEMRFLHVDLDPRARADVDDERKRIEELLTDELPEGIPAPSAVIDSGGGYWGFWRLKEPFPIGGDEAAYEEAKLYNLQLELQFGADSCHNVDQIARLPGTINYPDQKKQAKGRTVQPSRVLYTNDNIYPLSTFTKAPQVQAKKDGFSQGKTVEISENVQRLQSLDELPSSVPALCRNVIALGHEDVADNEEAAQFESRSEALWYVVCELVRNDCSDDMIYAIITDPDWAISESVIDGSNGRGDGYAKRQIERAREYAIDPKLAELNSRFAVVGSHGGKCRVLSWESQPMPGGESRETLAFQSFTDFRNRYSNRFVMVPNAAGNGTIAKSLGKWWLDHPRRRTYAGILFDPRHEGDVYRNGHEGDREYLDHNLWRGFGRQPKEGEFPLFLELVDQIIAGGDEAVSGCLGRWLAWAVQNPDRPAEVAVVLRGGQGTGKGTFARSIGRLFGQHFMHVSDSRAIAGKFNAHLRDCVILFADEAFVANQKDIVGTLKRTITEPTLLIEGKGENAVQWTNRLHIMMASNESWVVPAEIDERRFVVLDVKDAYRTVGGQPPQCSSDEYMAAMCMAGRGDLRSGVLLLAARRAEACEAIAAYDRAPSIPNMQFAADAMANASMSRIAGEPPQETLKRLLPSFPPRQTPRDLLFLLASSAARERRLGETLGQALDRVCNEDQALCWANEAALGR